MKLEEQIEQLKEMVLLLMDAIKMDSLEYESEVMGKAYDLIDKMETTTNEN
tara:strand:- start:12252 stop:12404 length:153 start_codon:yes stop_codon:yes gene_type:complete